MKAKALSLWQPWASAIALGAKLVETRPWATQHRGLLLIHAARTTAGGGEDVKVRGETLWRYVLDVPDDRGVMTFFRALPFGKLIARCRLVDCVPTQDVEAIREAARSTGQRYSPFERELGDYRRGRYAWILADVEPFAQPIAWRGQQGLFDVDLPEAMSA